MIIPIDQIPSDTLMRIAEEFVTRDGTDYGMQEMPLEQKVEQLLRQIKLAEVLVVFDEASESVNLVNASDYAQNAEVRGGLHSDYDFDQSGEAAD